MGKEKAVCRNVGSAEFREDKGLFPGHVELDEFRRIIGEKFGADLVEVFPVEAIGGDFFVAHALGGRRYDGFGEPGVEQPQLAHEGDVGGQCQVVVAVGEQVRGQQRGVERGALAVIVLVIDGAVCNGGDQVLHTGPQQLDGRVIERILLGRACGAFTQVVAQLVEVVVYVFFPEIQPQRRFVRIHHAFIYLKNLLGI